MPLVYYRRVADGTLVKPMSPAREKMKTYGLILPELRKAPAELKSARQKLKSKPTPSGPDQALAWRRSPLFFAENSPSAAQNEWPVTLIVARLRFGRLGIGGLGFRRRGG